MNRYIVTRTSLWDDMAACDGLTREVVAIANRRTIKTEAEHSERFPNEPPWRSIGHSHGTWKDGSDKGIVRYIDEHRWIYEGDLADFINKHGRCVVSPAGDQNDDLMEIEIYDRYRE